MVSILPLKSATTVSSNGCLSNKGEIICGVPQGSILGPLLFLIYINDLPNCLKTTTPCLYADDTQIFASSYDSVALANDINSDLENVTDWLNVNKLQSHPSKAKLIVMGSKQNLANKVGELYNSIIMNNNVVSNKCLGIDLDDRLTFDINIEEICNNLIRRSVQAYGHGGELNHSFRRPLVTLYKSLIQPYFVYCSPLWDTCDKILKDKLQILQNRAARVGARYDDKIRSSDLLEGLGWDNLHVRRAKSKSNILMYP